MCLLLGSHPEVLNHSLLTLVSDLAWRRVDPLMEASLKGLGSPWLLLCPNSFLFSAGREKEHRLWVQKQESAQRSW